MRVKQCSPGAAESIPGGGAGHGLARTAPASRASAHGLREQSPTGGAVCRRRRRSDTLRAPTRGDAGETTAPPCPGPPRVELPGPHSGVSGGRDAADPAICPGPCPVDPGVVGRNGAPARPGAGARGRRHNAGPCPARLPCQNRAVPGRPEAMVQAGHSTSGHRSPAARCRKQPGTTRREASVQERGRPYSPTARVPAGLPP